MAPDIIDGDPAFAAKASGISLRTECRVARTYKRNDSWTRFTSFGIILSSCWSTESATNTITQTVFLFSLEVEPMNMAKVVAWGQIIKIVRWGLVFRAVNAISK